jgi:hypothetical protein
MPAFAFNMQYRNGSSFLVVALTASTDKELVATSLHSFNIFRSGKSAALLATSTTGRSPPSHCPAISPLCESDISTVYESVSPG